MVEKAVSPSVKTPGFYQLLNLAAGIPSAGLAGPRALLISPKASAGTITADTEIRQSVAGSDAVATLLGAGTPGHLAAVALFAAYPLALVDVVAPAASGGSAASGTVTFTVPAAVSATQTVNVYIAGRLVQVFWLVGETVSQIATKLAAAVNSATRRLPVTASAALGVVTLSAKFAGAWGNDIGLRAELADGVGGAVAASAAALASGSGEMDVSTVLTLVQNREYDFIIPATSNADAVSSAGTSNPARIEAHIDANLSGSSAKYQQQIVGCTASLASAKTGAIARNHGPTQFVLCVGGQSLPAEWAAHEAGRRMRAESIDPVVNRIGDVYSGLLGPANLDTGRLTEIEVEDALNNGVSVIDFTAGGDPFMVRPITSRSQDADGNPDYLLLDVSGVSGAYAFMKDLRVTVPAEFRGAKIVPDQPAGAEPLPPLTVEPRDVREFVLSRAQAFVGRGILRGDKLTEALADGTFIVVIDEVDESQVNIVLPFGIVRPLAKFSMVGKRIA